MSESVDHRLPNWELTWATPSSPRVAYSEDADSEPEDTNTDPTQGTEDLNVTNSNTETEKEPTLFDMLYEDDNEDDAHVESQEDQE